MGGRAGRGLPRHLGERRRLRPRREPLRVPVPSGLEGVRRSDELPADSALLVLRTAPALAGSRPGDPGRSGGAARSPPRRRSAGGQGLAAGVSPRRRRRPRDRAAVRPAAPVRRPHECQYRKSAGDRGRARPRGVRPSVLRPLLSRPAVQRRLLAVAGGPLCRRGHGERHRRRRRQRLRPLYAPEPESRPRGDRRVARSGRCPGGAAGGTRRNRSPPAVLPDQRDALADDPQTLQGLREISQRTASLERDAAGLRRGSRGVRRHRRDLPRNPRRQTHRRRTRGGRRGDRNRRDRDRTPPVRLADAAGLRAGDPLRERCRSRGGRKCRPAGVSRPRARGNRRANSRSQARCYSGSPRTSRSSPS